MFVKENPDRKKKKKEKGLSLGEKTKNRQKIAKTSFNQKVAMVVKILIYT